MSFHQGLAWRELHTSSSCLKHQSVRDCGVTACPQDISARGESYPQHSTVGDTQTFKLRSQWLSSSKGFKICPLHPLREYWIIGRSKPAPTTTTPTNPPPPSQPWILNAKQGANAVSTWYAAIRRITTKEPNYHATTNKMCKDTYQKVVFGNVHFPIHKYD